MELEHWRLSTGSNATLGILYEVSANDEGGPPSDFFEGSIKFELLCWILEDEYREVKVAGETRIPAGRYRILLRPAGGVHNRYKDHPKIGPIHKGMLHLQDVPNFTWIYLHVGTREDHTDGCLLTGDGVFQNVTKQSKGHLMNSLDAYLRIYPRIAEAIESGEEVWITIRDIA